MQEYLEKYKDKPLAIRKLEDIMKNDTTLYIEVWAIQQAATSWKATTFPW